MQISFLHLFSHGNLCFLRYFENNHVSTKRLKLLYSLKVICKIKLPIDQGRLTKLHKREILAENFLSKARLQIGYDFRFQNSCLIQFCEWICASVGLQYKLQLESLSIYLIKGMNSLHKETTISFHGVGIPHKGPE